MKLIFFGFQLKKSGRKLERFSFLLGEDVKILIFFFSIELFLKINKSLGSSLFKVVTISVPFCNSTGKSFQEWTAISALFFRSSSLISFVKTPGSGIWCNGVDKSISPDVSLVKNSMLILENSSFIFSATILAWILASKLFLEIILIVFNITF